HNGIAPVVATSGQQCLVHFALGCPKFLRKTVHEWRSIPSPELVGTAAGQRETEQHPDPCARMNSILISLLDGAPALRRADLPTCARCPPPEEDAHRSSCGTPVEKCPPLQNSRSQRLSKSTSAPFWLGSIADSASPRTACRQRAWEFRL